MNSRASSCLTRALASSLLFAVLVPGAMAQANVQGQWSTLSNTMPINPVHVALLNNGELLVVAGSGDCKPTLEGCPSGPPYGPSNGSGALLLNPVTGQTISQLSVSWDMFCNGMVLLQDGTALIDGGTLQYGPFYGLSQAAIFDPSTNTFTNTANMAHGRWYPTVLTLSDGRIMTFSGLNEDGKTNATVEFYTVGSGWSTPFGSFWTPDLYPRLHLLPNGDVFYSGGQTQSKLFNPSTATWNTDVATTNYSGKRLYGTSVLLPLTPGNNYDPKVIIMGGGNPATDTTEIIDMGASTPAWQYGPNMSEARIDMNAVILPNGEVLALGGSADDEDTSTASLNADLYDPMSNTFTSAGANAYPRLYHSVALLLPNATVWLAGGNPSFGVYQQEMEIYQPAYLFNPDGTMATQPTITSAPSSISYGNTFSVTTPNAASISSVVLVRNGTVTHAFGMDQREVGLSFTAGSGTLTVTAPPNGEIAPPGYYMLFLVNNAGVPSVADFVQVTTSSNSSIGFVQVNSATPSSGSTVSVTYNQAQTAGDLNIVAVGWHDTTSKVVSVKDSLHNKYSLAMGPSTGTGLRQSIYYATNILAGSNTVTVTYSQSATAPDIRILEYKGVSTLDVTVHDTGSSGSNATVTSGSATTTSPNELVFAAGMTSGGFSASGSGFTNETITADGDIAEDQIVSVTGAKAATAVLGSSGTQNWLMQMATFK